LAGSHGVLFGYLSLKVLITGEIEQYAGQIVALVKNALFCRFNDGNGFKSNKV
jgi:hypothetical protein